MDGGAGGVQSQETAAATVGVGIHHGRSLPDFLQNVNLKYVKLGYHCLISHLLTLCSVPLIIIIIIEASQMDHNDLRQLWLHLRFNLASVVFCSAFLVFGSTVYIMTRHRPVDLVDYSSYRAPDRLKASFQTFMEHCELMVRPRGLGSGSGSEYRSVAKTSYSSSIDI